ncbi:hypothetical protein [Actinomadura chibensis]|uniref:Uncharacterized protein n=1 Tax=Actinomadura chibensis TaxID=392828 RepID=A0A5D0N9J6_9ACTN|nr:hypothetical protein [Actinomadura chibensis]TYB40905.1 hypothetical protein FXF69_38530 [Actinomadura chibensis]
MPRCTRCDAPLNGPPGVESTTRDEPPAPPWGAPRPEPRIPVPWETPPPPGQPPSDYTTPMPPSDETITRLSAEPWSEPAIWQPPAPPKKSRAPYFLAAAGVVLLLGLALGIVFWPSGSGPSAGPTRGGAPSTLQSQGAVPETEESASGGDLDAQAKAVDGLLEEMGSTRSDLGSVVVAGCGTSGLQRVLDARKAQLEKARALEVSALDNGDQMKDALVRALEASSESNQRYLDVAPGCPSDSEVADVNQRASDAKNEFIGYWAPIAEKAGLPARSADDI